jgi:hypothetical protein
MDDKLRPIYEAAGRPVAAKLRDAARRKRLEVPLKQAQAFVKQHAESQVFAFAPRAQGNIVSTQLNSNRQAD